MSNMHHLTKELIRRGITISVMESCTGGLFASRLTDTEGASEIFFGASVTYSNEDKMRRGVPEEVIARYGVYSKETATAMAEEARASYGVDLGVGITGTLGRTDPKNRDSVPGKVWIAVCDGRESRTHEMALPENGTDRATAKERVVEEAAKRVLTLLSDSNCEK